MTRLLSTLLGTALAAATGGCCIHTPAHCGGPQHSVADKMRLIQPAHGRPEIATADFTLGPDHRPVFIAKPPARFRHAPPVLLLHEMPALSVEAFGLAQRIADQGYCVYVPLLFGDIHDDPASGLLTLRRFAGFTVDPRWKAAYDGNAQLGVVDDLVALCRAHILPRHPGQHLGVIGLCISGSLPLALAAQLPAVAAPVLSQPAVPLIACTEDQRRSLGLSPAELAAVKSRTAHGLQILGFRFEGDLVSPSARFDRLREEFGSSAFLDRTLCASRYMADGLPYRAHAVLTSCYRPWHPPQPEPATHLAYRQLLRFLAAKLQVHPPAYPSPPAREVRRPDSFGNVGFACFRSHNRLPT